MKRYLLFVFLLLLTCVVQAQKKKVNNFNSSDNQETSDSSRKSLRTKKKEKEKPPITDYKIISASNDTTFVDTTLTIQKDYQFDYLRQDTFELLPVNNVGQSYTSLAKRVEYPHTLPLFGARARHFNYMEVEDINYYHVPTPLTELYFKTTFEQGQQLDAFFTVNTSPNLNLSIAYKGMRSLGKYQHALSSSGNFRSTASYSTPNKRYSLKAHFVAQDLMNEENGGLSEDGLAQYLNSGEFIGQEDEFNDRGAIEVNFEDAENTLLGKRFYLDHQIQLSNMSDSVAATFRIGHRMDLTDKSYEFIQTSPNTIFGESYVTSGVRDKVAFESFSNQLYGDLSLRGIGNLLVKTEIVNYNYGYNTLLTKINASGDAIMIPNRIKGDAVIAGGAYQSDFGKFNLFADVETIVSGDFDGYMYRAGMRFDITPNDVMELVGAKEEVAPNYNFLLYQSDYVNYNWFNAFENTATDEVVFKLKSAKTLDIIAGYRKISNYTYFGSEEDGFVKPFQSAAPIEVMMIKASKNIVVGKFGLDNTILYQNVEQDEEIYKVPDFVTRNTLYYQDHWFKKALFLQTGVTFKYFTSFQADAYDPVLAEFYVQNQQEIGGFPQFDIFFNAKVRQTRIFFKFENIGEAFSQNNEFSTPGYPTRDAVLRFGIVWNFFL
ncbi:putative porin [Aquimarina intermedia]|uniref:Putative beta-barrel porin n=1 Tax=Aquimarina intermedia TaxID=350814 RepID=A0A5S5CHA9_9FLAO|nr:putative porin [Aquimarina intermedia]TYP77403.1 putative beta-barrel porin [Aquimarina intermedia]